MSYRNDHDAALARVDALASENSQLAAENAKLRAGMTIVVPHAERSVNRGVAALALAALAGVGTLAAVVSSRAAHTAPVPHRSSPLAVVDQASLRACARTLELAPLYANAQATDPHGPHESVRAVLRSTGCRAEIRAVLDGAVLSPDERAALEKWSNTEATLDATASMVGEYYAHDPYVLDGYSTAPQLWTEYNRALGIRNVALAEWRESIEGTP